MPKDLLFLSLEHWDDIWRRNQFVCATLARRHPDMKILFSGPARDVSHAARRLNFKDVAAELPAAVPEFPNILLTRGIKLMPNSLAAGRRVNEALLRRHLRYAAARAGLRNPVLWINPHGAHHCVGRLGESAAVYDITDDWITFSQSPRETALIARQDAALCKKADAVIVCSQKLYDLKAGVTPPERLHLIPNGVDADHYRTVTDRSLALPAIARGWKRPVFGYTGMIHPARVDLELLDQLAVALPHATFAMVGPHHLVPETVARLSARGNIVFTGPVPYRDIPSYMRAFDVCMTPHLMTPFTESLNPIKLWEYLAAGKPIVATDVAGFRDYPRLVKIARTAADFAAALNAALAEPDTMVETRRAEARRHSWELRVDEVERVIDQALSRRRSAAPAHAG
jgi:glycosyltransferase involved in cell wall biosynthesis